MMLMAFIIFLVWLVVWGPGLVQWLRHVVEWYEGRRYLRSIHVTDEEIAMLFREENHD